MAPRVVWIGFPMILFLAILVLFGVAWLFNHHHWKPVVGILLFALGVGFFVFTGYFAVERASLREDYARVATQEPERMRQSSLAHEQANSDRERKQADAVARSDSNSAGKATEAVTKPSPPAASQPAAPRPRPDWLGRALHRTSLDNGQQVYETGVDSGPYLTEAECERAIIPVINDAVNKYVADYIPEATGQEIALEPDYVNSQLVKDTYWETVKSTVAPMNQLHALLVFDSQVRGDLIARARETIVGRRLKDAAACTGLVLMLLGGAYSLLKRGAARGTPVVNR
jgi:hypothetical protein